MLRGLDLERAKTRIDDFRETLLGDITFLKTRIQGLEKLDILDSMRRQVIDLAACLTSVAEEEAELVKWPNSTADLDARDVIGIPS